MKKLIILLLLLYGCYKSYTLEDKVIEDTTYVDSHTIISVDSAIAEADVYEEIEDATILDIDTAIVDIEKESETVSNKANSYKSAKQKLQEPILYDIVPKQGCTNKDTEIYLVGTHIHWKASIKIKYQLDAEFTAFNQKLVDECNRSLIDWYDLTMISFRTRDDIIFNDEYYFLSGEYKVMVVNPDDKESNEIGLSLQYCGYKVEEIKGCF